jgi:hypothetical protein
MPDRSRLSYFLLAEVQVVRHFNIIISCYDKRHKDANTRLNIDQVLS